MGKCNYHYVEYHGKPISLRKWCALWGKSYNTAICRWRRGIRDKWELIGFTEPQPFQISKEQLEWLRETKYARSGQKKCSIKTKCHDDEWIIACDLIGLPRRFVDEVKEAMNA